MSRRIKRGVSRVAQDEVGRRLKAYDDAGEKKAFQRLTLSIHEAGHAVCAVALGVPVRFAISRRVIVEVDGVEHEERDGTSGHAPTTPENTATIVAAGALAVNDSITTEDEFRRCYGVHDWPKVTPEGMERARVIVREHREEIARLALVLERAPKGLNERGVLAAMRRVPT